MKIANIAYTRKHTIPNYIIAYVTVVHVAFTCFTECKSGKALSSQEKFEKIEKGGTQEFMLTGRKYYTRPPAYEYMHLNSAKKFTSRHVKLEDAIAEYLANPDRDLTVDELIYKNLKNRSEQQAKVFVETYGLDAVMNALEMDKLQEKRICIPQRYRTIQIRSSQRTHYI